ncbi:MAG: hypothetical protein SF051_10325, partial [Elusimicrobiota bacterium]|nr:hypothetical protein [Elusimicrobiota bacterium]
MRSAARLLSALVLLAPGPAWAAVVSAPRASAGGSVSGVSGVATPVPSMRLSIAAPAGRLALSLGGAPSAGRVLAPAPRLMQGAPAA